MIWPPRPCLTIWRATACSVNSSPLTLFENQCYRASGLNLVVAAIILWNTVYLEKAIAKVRKHHEVPDDYLTYCLHLVGTTSI